MVPVALWGADVPGMKEVVASNDGKPSTLHYVKG
jgi:hypothetical protein